MRTVNDLVHPIRSAITVAGIVGYSRNNARICGSNASTTEPFAGREYFGAVSEANAARTVLRATPNRRDLLDRHTLTAMQTADLRPLLH